MHYNVGVSLRDFATTRIVVYKIYLQKIQQVMQKKFKKLAKRSALFREHSSRTNDMH